MRLYEEELQVRQKLQLHTDDVHACICAYEGWRESQGR